MTTLYSLHQIIGNSNSHMLVLQPYLAPSLDQFKMRFHHIQIDRIVSISVIF